MSEFASRASPARPQTRLCEPELEGAETFRLGLNYWPADRAMYWWWQFDPAAEQAELQRIASAGFRYLRFFLLWEAFQTEPGSVVESSLRHLEQFADAAQRAGLRLQPTLFTGHMSGANWLPAFATGPAPPGGGRFPTIVSGRVQPVGPANFYADERLIQAQELLAREVARVLAQHPALWSWDLGNEPSNLAIPPSREAGRRWLARMVGALRAGGSSHPVTLGLHMEDLEEDRRLGPREVAEACDYLCMHGYPLYARWARHDLDAALLPFLGLVTQWLGGGRPLLFQEFGLPAQPARGPSPVSPGHHRLYSESEAAGYYQDALAELTRERFMGAFAWCANDYSESLWTKAPFADSVHERFFGLFRADGSAKLALGPWRELQAGLREPAVCLPPRGLDWIDVEPAEFWQSPLVQLQRLYGRFLAR